MTDEPKTKRPRVRFPSLKKQLQAAAIALGKAADDPELRPGRKADVLLQQGEILLRLQRAEEVSPAKLPKSEAETYARIAELEAKLADASIQSALHEFEASSRQADKQRVAELEKQNKMTAENLRLAHSWRQ
jgi:hypothetical protein